MHAGGRPQGPSKQEYRAQYPDARPFSPVEPGLLAETSHGQVVAHCQAAGYRVQCAGEFSERSLKGGGPPPGALASGARVSGSVTRRSDHFEPLICADSR